MQIQFLWWLVCFWLVRLLQFSWPLLSITAPVLCSTCWCFLVFIIWPTAFYKKHNLAAVSSTGQFASSVQQILSGKTKKNLRFQKSALESSNCDVTVQFHLCKRAPTLLGIVYDCRPAGLIKHFDEMTLKPHLSTEVIFSPRCIFGNICAGWFKPKDAQEFDRLLKWWHE